MAAPGLRERKKARTRLRLAEVALARYNRDGFDATSVRDICEEAEVAVSTFYKYFDGKEAVAFADDEDRAAAVATVLRDGPAGEPPHVLLRRASLALAERDLGDRDAFTARVRLTRREPALAAYGVQRQARHAETFALLLAARLDVDPARDLRPRLLVSAAFGALNSAWAIWAADGTRDLRALVNQAHDLLDAGFAATGGRVLR